MNKKFESELITVFQKASKDKNLLKEFLSDILTPGEYTEVMTRWQIVKRLAEGEPQRTIAGDLKVGIATVTRGSREFKNKNGGFYKMIKKI